MKNQFKHRLNFLSIPFLLSVMVLLSACNGEDPLPLENIREVFGADNGNNGDGSDIEVFFTKQLDFTGIAEYRAMVIKADGAVDFGLAQGASVAADSYVAAFPEDVFPVKGITFLASTKDSDGDPITNNQAYYVGVMSVSNSPKNAQSSFLLSENAFTLTENNIVTDFSSEIFAGTSSITIDPEGNIFMGDYSVIKHLGGSRGKEFTMRKIATNRGVSEVGEIYELLVGNAHDANGIRYQSTLYNSGILKCTPGGEITPLEHEGENIVSPDGIYIDAGNNLFVADQQQRRILKITPEGTSSIFAEVGAEPRGVTGDDNGNIYVSHNVEEGTISKITSNGEVTTFGNIPTFVRESYRASGVKLLMWVGYIAYHKEHLYVTGMSTDQIFKFDLNGNMEVFAGSGTRGIPRGGALTANLNRPMGLAFSADGSKLFVSFCTDTMPQHTQASYPSKILQIEIND